MEENKENNTETKFVSFEDSPKSGEKGDEQNEVQKEETANKPARAKSANVLKNKTFQPPRVDTLKRATQYRLCKSAKPKSSTTTSPKVLKRRRRKITDASSGSESDTDHVNSKAYIPHDVDNGPGYFDPSEDYDFDCDDTPRYEIEEKEHPCQIIYKTMCKNLHVTPSASVYKSLVGSDVILKHHLLGKKGTKALATALVDNLSVRTLVLQDNDIRSEGAIYVTDMLKENLNISELTLADNSIGTQGLKVLMNIMSSHENIVKLNLSGNDFDENDAVYIATMLEENTIIKELDLSHNKFRERGGIIIGQALGGNDAIEKLNLSWNHLRRDGVVAISQSLERNISITDLNVSWNGFYLEGSRALCKVLRANKTLEKLDLTCNRIDFECLQQLVNGLSGNSTLQQLFLSNNPISAQGAYLLLKTIKEKEAIKIEHLDISTQCIEVKFLQILEELRDRQVIHVRHGIILDQNTTGFEGDEEFSHEDPMMVMMELMSVMRLRLIDLFSTLDKDQSKSLSAEELKRGLMAVHVPMTEKAIERLVKKLDTDGDGEVDFGELLEGQKEHNNKLRRLKQLESDLPFAETELGRIHFKLKHLMLTGQAHAIKKAQEQKEQRARDRLIAIGE